MNDTLLHKRVLGRYRIVRSLAMGGMGVIYLGRSEGAAGFTKPVVIKRIVADYASFDADAERYFVREATILSQIRHPGIVGVVDFGEEDGAYTMVLEYVHGFNLGQWHRYLRQNGELFPAELAIHIVRLVLEALDHAHHLPQPDGTELHVVHRDVTLSNVLLDVTGMVKLADFGIARVSKGDDEKTQSGMLRGKMPYLAPELLHGQAASIASDIYSAGVLLHELLIGRNEWKSNVPAETVRLVLEHRPTAVETARSDAPKGIDAVLAKALAKDPKDRWRSARDFADALYALPLPAEGELDRKLTDRVKHDFEGEMPAALGVEPLSVLDDAWRNARRSFPPGEEPPPDVLAAPPPPPAPSPAPAHEDPTTQSRLRPKPHASKRSPAMIAAVAVALAGIGVGVGAVVIVKSRNRPQAAPRFIVVETDPGPTDEAPEPTPATDGSVAPPVEPAARVAPPEPVDAGRAQGATASHEPTGVERLTRVFATRRGAVRGCFERNTLELAGRPSIEIRFRIDASGHVTSAGLSPSSLEGTDLGRCLLGVARSTDFGPQPGPVGFGIPVTASLERR